MATELSRDALRQLARVGAQRRLEELRQEEAAIRAAFPDLDDTSRPRRGRRGRPPGRSAEATATARGAAATDGRTRRRRRKPMSAAQKRAVSERMKKYWAARRKANG